MTVYTLGGISFNSGPDVNGTLWIGDVPEGWESTDSLVELLEKASANGQIVTSARQTGRAMSVNAHAVATSNALMWTARNQLEAAANGMIAANGTLTVTEPGGAKSLGVRYVGRMRIRQLSGLAFEFQLPIVAPAPAKV